ncbi:MAG: hypothetical protein ACTTH7_04970 [Treponema sp.]
MASYYYLMSQLPSIMPHADPPLTYTQFKEIARRFLTDKDAADLEYITLHPMREPVKAHSNLVTAWCRFDRELRLALEQMRAAKLKWDVPSDVSGEQSSVFDVGAIIRGVSTIDDPLAAEQFLLNARLAAAEQLRRLHYFDSDAVFGYGIVLLLSERASKFKVETGREAYHSVYTQILGERT